MKLNVFWITVILLVISLSCGKDATDPNPPTDDVNEFLKDLPAWSEFSPLKTPVTPTQTDSVRNLPDVTMDVEVIGDSGEVVVVPDVVYECTEIPYTVTDNPVQIVMYNPDVEILWPGALIQGKNYRDGIGSLLPLVISERNSIEVSIPGLANNDNFRTVDAPTQAKVAQAIGSMVGNATAEGLSTPSAISFEQNVYHSESSFGLSVKVSGRYLGFEASASGSIDRNASETTVTAQFYQRMYEVVVAPPQTPGAFFSSAFTSEKLQEQINLGRIGNDNIPVYVSNIVYGRMMMFSMTSTASEQDIRATLNAAYNGIAGNVMGSLSAKQQTILQQSKIAITSYGGNAEATIAMIKSGNWTDYFTNSAPLTSASPLSYTFRNLGDGSIAAVSEVTDYNIRVCQARASVPGTFNFLPEQNLALGIPTPVETLTGDINDDGLTDIVFSHLNGNINQTAIAFANGDGSFSISAPVVHPETPADSWGAYTLLLADMNGDGRDDLVWSMLEQQNHTYIALSNGDGSFDFKNPVIHSAGGWGNYIAYTGDVDGDGKDDMIWNGLSSSGNRTYIGLSNGDGSLMLLPFKDFGLSGWQTYRLFIGNINNDNSQDLVWNTLLTTNRNYAGLANGDGTWTSRSAQDHPNSSWSTYSSRMSDVNGDNLQDFVWTSFFGNSNLRIYTGLANGNGSFSFPAFQDITLEELAQTAIMADVNNDGRQDIIVNYLDTINRTYVGLSVSNGFDFSRENQLHPDIADWSQYSLNSGDLNGDGKDDLIWIQPSGLLSIYIGLVKE